MIIPPELLEDFKTLQSPLKDTTILWHRPGHQPLFPEHDKKEGWINIHCLNEGEETPQSMDAETIILKAVGLHGEWNVDVINKMVAASIASKQATIGPAHAAWYLFIFGTENPTEGHFSLAGKLLEIAGIKNSDEWRVKFGTAIWEKCTHLIKYLEKSMVPLNAVDDGEKFVQQHRAFLEYIGTLKGGQAKHELKTLRSIKDGRWDLFKPLEKIGYAPRFAVSLAYICLEDEIRPAIERVEKNQPALPLVISDRASAVFGWTGARLKDGQIKNKEGDALASINVAVLSVSEANDIDHTFGLLRSMTGQRLVRALITKCARQSFASNTLDTRMEFSGGWAGLTAELVGTNSKRQVEEVKNIITIGKAIHMQWPGSDAEAGGGFWFWGKEGGLIWIRLHDALSPFYALKNLGCGDRILVPVLAMPAVVNAKKWYAPQCAFQFSITKRLVIGRKQIKELGGIIMTPEDFYKEGKRHGLSAKITDQVIDRWLNDGDDGERMLDNNNGVWHLADNATYGAARRFIDNGARCGERRRAKMVKRRRLDTIEAKKD